MFVNEAVFILEQITQHRLGASLEIRNKFNKFDSKSNVFSQMIFQCWFNIFERFFITKLYGLEKHSSYVSCLKGHSLYYNSLYV